MAILCIGCNGFNREVYGLCLFYAMPVFDEYHVFIPEFAVLFCYNPSYFQILLAWIAYCISEELQLS